VRSLARLVLVAGLVLFAMSSAWGAERFPPPDFTGGHVMPETTTPEVSPRTVGWIDVVLLAVGLAFASWISIRQRSRAALVVLSLVSLAYFGFWKQGCVCAIGSVQNVALGVADSSYAVPLTVMAFFALPLVFGLIWGRGFCAGVCPHGAIQDLVLVKPVKVPGWLDEALRVGPWIYLGLGILLAATGGLFIICKFDPFVGIFRMTGSRFMMVTGAALLVLSMFVGRPYCRYLCPYGALMGLVSRVAKWRPTVTPDNCTQCRLCESACPFGALTKGTAGGVAAPGSGRRRVMILLIGIPVGALVFGWIGGRVGTASMAWHPAGELAELLVLEKSGALGDERPDELVAFYHSSGNHEAAFAAAAAAESRAAKLGWLIGAILGMVFAVKIARAFYPARLVDYETDSGRCVSCARCYSACPYELVRRGIPVTLPEGGERA